MSEDNGNHTTEESVEIHSEADIEVPVQDVPEDPREDNTEVSEETETVSNKSNYEVIKDIFLEAEAANETDEVAYALNLFMESPGAVEDKLNAVKSLNELPGDKETIQKWASVIEVAFPNYPPEHYRGVNPFGDPDSNWRQALSVNGQELFAGVPKFSSRSGSLSGDSADLRIRSAAGLGTIMNVPLYHTGLWAKIKAPSDGALHELERRIVQDKSILARSTIGVAFTNASFYVNTALVDMILNYIYNITYKDMQPNTLKSIIKVTDIPQLVWGISCAIWPDGYQLNMPCLYDHNNCNHVESAKLNLSKISWVDNRKLSNYQKNHMADRNVDKTDESLDHYSKEHIAPQSKEFVAHSSTEDNISIYLEVPTIQEYETAGNKWIKELESMADEVFGQSPGSKERDNYILEQMHISDICRYSHWVKEIRFEEGATITERESIDESLKSMSGSDVFRNKIISEIEDFIAKSVVSAIGVPKYKCPSCKKEPDPSHSPHGMDELYQLEINELFFTLRFIRVEKILSRS